MTNIIKSNKGLTLIELLVTLSILAVLSVVVINMYININNVQVKSTVRKETQEELRDLLEKIAQDVKNSSVDYRSYYILNGPHATLGEATKTDSNLSYIGIPNPFPTGGDALNPAPNFLANDKNEDILILLNPNGTERIKYRLGGAGVAGVGMPSSLMKNEQEYSTTGQCHDLPEVSYDGSHSWNSLYTDPDHCWVQKTEYPYGATTLGYLPLSSPKITISALKFFFRIHKSPFKVYEEDAVQRQPMVTIKISGKYTQSEGVIGGVPEITLQTTITSRNYEEITWQTS